MREIGVEEITASVADMVVAANRYLPPDVLTALEGGLALEKSAAGLIKNSYFYAVYMAVTEPFAGFRGKGVAGHTKNGYKYA